ncbi:hypothetical protein LUZ60_001052 [Juncus effusus]|nr:hypothetical protein LUZ60_001052 [Juncus effusus]
MAMVISFSPLSAPPLLHRSLFLPPSSTQSSLQPPLSLRIRCRTFSNSDPTTLPSSSSPPENPSPELRVVFSGTETGSHIYSSIAIADALSLLHPNSNFLFLGRNSSDNSLESTVIPSAGYSISPIDTPLLSFSLLLPISLLCSTVSSLFTLSKFKPHIIVGTGGYLSVPACLSAFILGIKIVIQEQNSYPGMENWLLGRLAERVFLGFNTCVKYFQKDKCLVYGNPVRVSLRKYTSKAVARSHFFPTLAKKKEMEPQVILVLGGSTGATAVNYTVLNMYSDILKEHKNWYIVWQTGPDRYAEVESLVKRSKRLYITPFLHEMDLAYAAADVIVSRAGAMTCTEILVTGKPAILVPLSNAPNDIQTKNSFIMSEIAGSKVLTEDELDSSSLEFLIHEILGNEKLREEISEKALNYATRSASNDIAQCILSLVKLYPSK